MKLTAWELFPLSIRKVWMIMRLSTVFILFFALHLSANTTAQKVTLSVNEISMDQFLVQLQRQTPYSFVIQEGLVPAEKKISIHVKDTPLEIVLDQVLKPLGLSFQIEEQAIYILKARSNISNEQHHDTIPRIDITGRILDSLGNPLVGASIIIKGSRNGTTTDKDGNFQIKGVDSRANIIVSYTGYKQVQYPINGKNDIIITMESFAESMQEVVINKGYYNTTNLTNTGNVSVVTSKTIEKQPVNNVLAALEGRVTGLIVTQGSGVPGSSFKLQLRGQNSLSQGNDPFIIIDGVPFAPNNSNINQVSGAFSFDNKGLSPFSSINPADIESIEVLKDADATAIYGSRGANGVILITTKKGKPGPTKVDFNIRHGFSDVVRKVPLLNTSQYIQMRKEAFANDSRQPTNGTAYDFLVWDTTRYTDWQKLLIGGTAQSNDVQLGLSGGSANTHFLMNATFHDESTVYPGNMKDTRSAFHLNVGHHSTDNKFTFSFTGNYTIDNNDIINSDLASYMAAIPNLPPLYDSSGNLQFSQDGHSYNNPLSFLLRKYNVQIDNLIANLQLGYKLGLGLTASINMGYNAYNVREMNINPIAAQNPAFSPTGSSEFGENHLTTLIVEPQLEYQHAGKNGKLSLLLGGTWQQNTTNGTYIFADGYTSDALLQSVAGAAAVYPTSTALTYKYAAAFLRAGYNWKNKYLLNLTGRRDGSSRFGSGKQFANFGAIGAGWIFSSESWMQQLNIFSYGKLRASYGTSGNDAIGDYKYLSTYGPTLFPYQDAPGLRPTGLYNADYNWEINKKLEIAMELGWFNDRLLFNVAWYDNRCSNQLVDYSLPAQTGFSNIIRNFPAVVQNTGFEMELSLAIIKRENLKWQTSLSLTIPRNKLLSYPGIENSSYRYTYAIGKSLNVGNGFKMLGVDPATGVYSFADNTGHATAAPSYPDDYVVGLANLDPKYYGAFNNTVTWKQFQLSIFFEFRKQTGYNYTRDVRAGAGIIYGQPAAVLDRWQKPGDITSVQKYTSSFSSPAYQAVSLINAYGASLLYADASYIRLKNIAVSYDFKTTVLKKIHVSGASIFCQAQNLLTITGYYGADPETQSFFHLPTLRTIAVGIHLTF